MQPLTYSQIKVKARQYINMHEIIETAKNIKHGFFVSESLIIQGHII